ncbi:MAG: hypothetical protein PGN13_12975 [Patulibacter minatonensis]
MTAAPAQGATWQPVLLRLAGWLLALSTLTNALWAPWSDPWFGFAGLLAVGLVWASVAPTTAAARRRGLLTATGAIGGYAVAVGVFALTVALLDLEMVFHDRALVQPTVVLALVLVLVTGALGGVAREVRARALPRVSWQRAAIAAAFLAAAGVEAAGERWVSAGVAILAAVWLDLVLGTARTAGSADAPAVDRLVRRLRWRAPVLLGGLAVLNAALFVGTAQPSGFYFEGMEPFDWSVVRPGAAGFLALAIYAAASAASRARALTRGVLLTVLLLAGGAVLLTGWFDVVGGDRPWWHGLVRLAGPFWAFGPVDWTADGAFLLPLKYAVVDGTFVILLWFLPVLGVLGRRARMEPEGVRSLALRAAVLTPFAMLAVSSATTSQPVATVVAALSGAWLDRALRLGRDPSAAAGVDPVAAPAPEAAPRPA